MPLTHQTVSVTGDQRVNLIRLAEFLDAVEPVKFHMSDFTSEEREDSDIPVTPYEVTYECGTVACAVGYGPKAGIAPSTAGETWWQYAERAFGAGEDSALFSWAFGGDWYDSDNTPSGAASRIRYALDHGIPADAKDQQLGDAPLSYKAVA